MSRFKFLLEAIKNFQEVGTVTRSGKMMRKKVASLISKNDLYILELGAGDGVLTRSILESMGDGKLLCFEINPNMYQEILKINDPRLIAINDTAENIEQHMKVHNIEAFDAIVSAIPYIVLPAALADKILAICKKNLKKGKSFLQVHYAKTLLKKYKALFGNIIAHRIYMNIPPAYLFQCIKGEE